MNTAVSRTRLTAVYGPVAALLFNAFVWGVAWWPFRALEARGLHALWATALVYTVGAALFVLARPGVLTQMRRHPALLFLALSSGLTNVCFNWAVTLEDVVRVVLLFYLMPAWSILLAWALLDERPTPAALLRLALALAGVSLVLQKPGAAWPVPQSLGDGLAVAGGFCFALTGVLLRRWRHTPGTARTFAMFAGSAFTALGAAIVALLLQWAAAPAWGQWSAWAPWALLLMACLLLGNIALQYGTARLQAQTAALIMLSEIVFASVSSVLLGAAKLTAATVGGGLMILSAALLAVIFKND